MGNLTFQLCITIQFLSALLSTFLNEDSNNLFVHHIVMDLGLV